MTEYTPQPSVQFLINNKEELDAVASAFASCELGDRGCVIRSYHDVHFHQFPGCLSVTLPIMGKPSLFLEMTAALQ